MHKSNEDCFYFLTSSCTKGSLCTYRHSPLALACNVICPSWLRGACLDPACPLRHSKIQRPAISNGILCFYENTATGCLKPDCTFIHSRPRLNLRNGSTTIRPITTNLVNKDASKPIIINLPSTKIPPTPSTMINPPPITSTEVSTEIPININESSSKSDATSPLLKTETLPRRIALTSDIDQQNEVKTSSDNNTSLNKSTIRSVITDVRKKTQEETTTPPQSRLVTNRNVVIGESPGGSNRKIVQTTLTSSNRIVVSSDNANSSDKLKRTNFDVMEQENNRKKLKSDTPPIDISFPCSTPSLANRLLILPTKEKETATSNDTKPIRLKRDRLPATKPLIETSSKTVSVSSNEEKTSAGTCLSKDEERRTMRIERFQKKPNSPPRSVISTTSISTLDMNLSNNNSNIIKSFPNQRKRTAPTTTIKEEPPLKRALTAPSQLQSSVSQVVSTVKTSMLSLSQNKSSSKKLDQSIGKTSSSITKMPQKPVISTSLTLLSSISRPSQPSTATSQSRQPPTVVIKRPVTSMTNSAQIQIKSNEQRPLNVAENKPSVSKRTTEPQIFNEEDENQLLKNNESADVVDTFALIDEALLEADHLLELL